MRAFLRWMGGGGHSKCMSRETVPEKRQSFPIGGAVVGIVLVLIPGILAMPVLLGGTGCGPSKVYATLNRARQIHQAAYRMVLDNADDPDPDLGWPGELAESATNPISTTGQYVERMVDHRYLDRGSLAKLFAGPDVSVYPGTGPFQGKYSAFNVYKVTGNDPDNAIFLATKNFTYGSALDPTKPYGDKGCMIMRKGGDALLLTAGQAMTKNVGVMPGGTADDPGEQNGKTLED